MARRSSGSATEARTRDSSSGISRVTGTARAMRRSGGRSTTGTAPTRKRSSRATTPRSFKRAHTSSARRESSLAHTLLGTRRRSVPSSSEIGKARSAIRAPTASRQTAAGTASRTRAKRFSPARSRIARSGSGDERGYRERRAIRIVEATTTSPGPYRPGLRRETSPSGASGSNTAPRRSVVPARRVPSAKSIAYEVLGLGASDPSGTT